MCVGVCGGSGDGVKGGILGCGGETCSSNSSSNSSSICLRENLGGLVCERGPGSLCC